MDNVVFEYSTDAPECDCGSIAVMAMSKGSANPGRRYWKCSNAIEMCDSVRFLGWRDPPITGRARDIINHLSRSRRLLCEALPNLLRSTMQHRKNIQMLRRDMKDQEKLLKILICVIGVLVVLLSAMFGYVIR